MKPRSDRDERAGFLAACEHVVGQANVLTASDEMVGYSEDFWGRYRGQASLIVKPSSAVEVGEIVKICGRYSVSIVPQGGNTGLVAGGIPDQSGRQLLLSMKKLNRIREIRPDTDVIVAEAGCILADVQRAADEVDRYFPLSIGSQGSCTIGGNLATNAGGINVIRYGMMRDLVLGLEVVLPDGRIWNGLRTFRKDNTGYDLKQLFIGSEGTLGVITAAALQLRAQPRERVTVWLGIESSLIALKLLEKFRTAFGETISSFELLDENGVELAVANLAEARRPVADRHAWHLLIELTSTFQVGLREHVEEFLERLQDANLFLDGTIANNEIQRRNMWRIREGQSEAAKQSIVVRSDVSVPIEKIPQLLSTMASLSEQYTDVLFTPFGHLGDGNVHVNFVVPKHRVEQYEPRLLSCLFEEVYKLNGSISAEHGVGRIKRAAVARQKPTEELDLTRLIKSTLDPKGLFNPGVIFGFENSEGGFAH